MPSRRTDWPCLSISLLLFILITLPYLWAARAGGDAYVFGGFLVNPVDGNSYLAKMYQGWQGDWQFALPYTAEPGEGSYLFLFYLSLGQLARASGLSLMLVYHLARLGASLFMLVALWRFYKAALASPGQRRLAFAIAVFGSGMGWLAAPFGGFTADFWVSEAYPFLSAYTNPHFPLGLALLLTGITPCSCLKRWWRSVAEASAIGLSLGIVMPFGLVVAGATLAGLAGWDWLESRADRRPGSLSAFRAAALFDPRSHAGRVAWLLAGGLPVVAYDFWVTISHPVLSGWNAQNLTPSPTPWDMLISFSPVLLLALAGLPLAYRSSTRGLRVSLIWALAGCLLLYLPFGLQRRLMLGLYVPLAGLAVLGLEQLARRMRAHQTGMGLALLLLAIPTNLLVLLAAVYGIQSRSIELYLTREERLAFAWIAENTPRSAVILAAPETGLLIPAYTGRRVLYGHPMETVSAGERKAAVIDFFAGGAQAGGQDILNESNYVFLGPSERALGGALPFEAMQPVYQAGEAAIYLVTK